VEQKMSFFEDSKEIKENDLVLAWMTRTNVKPIKSQKDQLFNTRYGAFPHNKIIGSTFGTQIASTSDQGFIHLLAPTPELWSMSLPHRTQIVYTPDASYIVQRLRIRPGSRVIEAGTGSGSFTHSITRSAGRKGRIFTYEFHEPRYLEAKKEINDHGLDTITITHRDVCKEGFDLEGENLNATAVFLDLPSPWAAIPRLKSVVTNDRAVSICCFSPCMEQVVRTVETLRKEGFQRIEMVEVSAKRWEGRKDMVRTVDDAVERLRDVKKRRTEGLEKRNKRIQNQGESKKRKGEEETDTDTPLEGTPKEDSPTLTPNQGTPNEGFDKPTSSVKGYNPWGKGLRVKEGDPEYDWRDISRVEAEIKSHTSYLTFAILPPKAPEMH
jgi:tRNA (adenine57-N1/adenine58-N1)-methyltransferase